jgi:ABC-type transport system involved in cytochrome c biogenesis permease subunit
MSDDLLWLTVMVMGASYALVIGAGLLAIAYIIRRTRRT